MRDAQPRAAGAELHHVVAWGIRKAASETFGEAKPIRIVADPLAILQHDRVNGSERTRVVRQIVEKGYHQLLARVGNVESRKAHPLCCGYEFGECLGAKSESRKVVQSVNVTQALRSTFALVHCRSE